MTLLSRRRRDIPYSTSKVNFSKSSFVNALKLTRDISFRSKPPFSAPRSVPSRASWLTQLMQMTIPSRPQLRHLTAYIPIRDANRTTSSSSNGWWSVKTRNNSSANARLGLKSCKKVFLTVNFDVDRQKIGFDKDKLEETSKMRGFEKAVKRLKEGNQQRIQKVLDYER